MIDQLREGLKATRGRLQEFEETVGDVSPFSMGEILDDMIDDFNIRWGDASDLLMFKYGPEDKHEIIWGRVEDSVETLMKEREEQKDGKGKEVVDEEGLVGEDRGIRGEWE